MAHVSYILTGSYRDLTCQSSLLAGEAQINYCFRRVIRSHGRCTAPVGCTARGTTAANSPASLPRRHRRWWRHPSPASVLCETGPPPTRTPSAAGTAAGGGGGKLRRCSVAPQACAGISAGAPRPARPSTARGRVARRRWQVAGFGARRGCAEQYHLPPPCPPPPLNPSPNPFRLATGRTAALPLAHSLPLAPPPPPPPLPFHHPLVYVPYALPLLP